MKRFILLTFIFFCFNLTTVAQLVKINGIITDSISKSPLAFVNVIVTNTNDSLLKGTMSNSEGQFNVNISDDSKKIKIHIKHIGYIDYKILTTICSDSINVGTVELAPSNYLLDQVVVEGQMKHMSIKFDRKIYSISELKIASAKTIFDLLRDLPGVVVDEEGNVRYRGAEATFFVDDLLLKYSYSRVDMIPYENVEKIELIDATMRIGGDGRGGIINIRLKHSKEEGFSGLISSSINSNNFKEINKSKQFLNINFIRNKLTFFVNSSYENNITTTNTALKKTISLSETISKQEFNSMNNYIRYANYNYAGLIYAPSKNSKFNMTFALMNSKDKSLSNSLLSEYNHSHILSNRYYNLDNSTSDQYNNGFTISFWHKMDTLDSYFKIIGNVGVFDGMSDEKSRYTFDRINSVPDDSLDIYSNVRYIISKSANINLVFNRSINRNSRLNVTYNLSSSFFDSSANKHYSYNQLQLVKSQFDVNENYQHNLSFRIGTQKKKWKFDCGLNASFLSIKGQNLRYISEMKDTLLNLSKNFKSYLPSLTISYLLNKSAELKLTLAKTSSFPYFSQLSDYIDKNYKLLWFSGNSSLSIVDFYSLYIGYSFYTEKLNFSAEYFYNYTNNEIVKLSIPLTSLLFLYKPYNVTEASNTGIDLSTFIRLNKNLNLSVSSSIFHIRYNINRNIIGLSEKYDMDENKSGNILLGYYFKSNLEYRFKDFYFMLYFNYYSRERTFTGYNKESFNSSINLSKKYFNNKFRVSVGLSNIFAELFDYGSYSDYFGVNSESTITSSRNKKTCVFSMQYNFRHGDRGTKDYK